MQLACALVLVGLCALASSATAQVRPEPIKLTLGQADRVLVGLAALDGYNKVIKDGTVEKSVRVNYEFSGKLRLLLARDIDTLRPALERAEKARQGLISQAKSKGGGKMPDPTSVEQETLTREIQAIFDTEEQFDLLKIQADELKLDVNPVPPTVLSQISAVLTEAK